MSLTKEEVMAIVRDVIRNELDIEVSISAGSSVGFVEVTTRCMIGDELIYANNSYDYVRVE